MGVDVMYSKLHSASMPGNIVPTDAAIWWRDSGFRRRQLAVPLPRASRLLSLIA